MHTYKALIQLNDNRRESRDPVQQRFELHGSSTDHADGKPGTLCVEVLP